MPTPLVMKPIRSRVVGPYMLYEYPDYLAPYYIGPAEGPEPDKWAPSFYTTVAVHNPVLISRTADGFTTAFEKLEPPLTVMLLHTPDTCRHYEVVEFMSNADAIMRHASIDLFDWYWMREYSCFRQLLKGQKQFFLNGQRAITVTMSENAEAMFKSDELERPVTVTDPRGTCLKEDIIECWDDHCMLGGLATSRGSAEFLELPWYISQLVINGTIIIDINTLASPMKINIRTLDVEK